MARRFSSAGINVTVAPDRFSLPPTEEREKPASYLFERADVDYLAGNRFVIQQCKKNMLRSELRGPEFERFSFSVDDRGPGFLRVIFKHTPHQLPFTNYGIHGSGGRPSMQRNKLRLARNAHAS